MRDLALRSIHNSVPLDRLAAWVHESHECQPEVLSHLLELIRRIDADGPHFGLDYLELIDGFLQLSELAATIGSPGSAEEDQDEVLPAPEFAQPMTRPVRCTEREVGRHLTDLNPLERCR